MINVDILNQVQKSWRLGIKFVISARHIEFKTPLLVGQRFSNQTPRAQYVDLCSGNWNPTRVKHLALQSGNMHHTRSHTGHSMNTYPCR